MEIIELKTLAKTSKILIEDGLLEKSGKMMKEAYPSSKFAIITDSNIEKIYGEKLKEQFPDAHFYTIPAGEESKQFKTIIDLIEKLLEAGFARNDVLIGFGGGMATDVAGFVASIFMRGMKYVVFPTSLLSMVDAAIGGKTGINLVAKNIVGTIYLSDFILIDPGVLKSFPDPKKLSGMGEVIKYASTVDKSLFDDLEKEPLDLTNIIIKSVKAKSNIVSQDLNECKLRKILNYGHTFGHAIETAMKLKLSHDHSISIGMVIANKVAQKLGKQEKAVGDKIEQTLKTFYLPTELPSELTIEGLTEYIKKDKKRRGNIIDYVIAPEIGRAEILPMTVEELVNLAK